ncbi:MAG: hypothetical protein ABSA26_06905 [Thermoguttaceae bacterium]|jgi:hypothetical protein
MDPAFNNLSHAADDRFDRLVDGELSESQRTELLTSLDREPDGWRCCALAFLEAQCWKKELGAMRQSMPAGISAPAPVPRPAKRKSTPFGLPGTLVSMAACFLLALGAGILWRHSGNRTADIFGVPGSDQIARKTPGQSATNPLGTQTAVAQAAAQSQNASEPWQWVKLSPAGSDNSGEAVQLPALQRDRIDQQWLQSLTSPIPENVVQSLRRNGYEVQTQQRLMPMPLKDGRRLVVPVDQVQLQYVGNTTY